MTDLTLPKVVEIQIRGDGKVVWINVDGVCQFRASGIGMVRVIDERKDRAIAVSGRGNDDTTED